MNQYNWPLHGLITAFIAIAVLFLPSPTNAAGWLDPVTPTSNNLYGLDCVSTDFCVAVGEGGTIVNNNGSKTTWTARTSGVTTTLNNVDAYSSSLILAVGNGGVILRSTDQGNTWSVSTSGTTEILYGIKMVSTSVGWAAGEDSKILKTTDGGVTWSVLSTAPAIDAMSIDALSSNYAWVAGKSGAVYKTTNGGTTWTDISISTSNIIYSIDMYNSNILYAGGSNRSVYKTTDGGTTWSSSLILTDFGVSEIVSDLEFVNSNIGTIVGNDGTIASGTDGTTFTEDTTTFTSTGVYDVSSLALNARYAVGANGLIAVYDGLGPAEPENFAMQNGEYTNDRTPTVSWDVAIDDEGADILRYEITTDGGTNWDDVGTDTSFTFPINLALGEWTASVRAIDEFGNEGNESDITFTIEQTNPTVGTLSPITATTGTATQIYTTASDTSGIEECLLYINSSLVGPMIYDSVAGIYTYEREFETAGSYSAYAYCADSAGNEVAGATSTITVTGSTVSTDSTAPSVGSLTPTTATEDTAVTLTASVSDAGGLDYCKLYVGGSFVGYMTVGSSTATYSYTFTTSGVKTANVYCVDDAGNATRGSDTTITVSASTASSEAEEGNLLKLACPGGESATDPCRAVYYYGTDGKRHAFPNEKVFFTWYEDFDDVIVVTSDFLASLTLGRNVTYHPGSTMVKFITVNTVYAVGEDGELRGINSEDTARSIFGSTWNQQIHDISDAFYGNYTFGEDIDSTSDYDPDDAYDAVDSIDDIL